MAVHDAEEEASDIREAHADDGYRPQRACELWRVRARAPCSGCAAGECGGLSEAVPGGGQGRERFRDKGRASAMCVCCVCVLSDVSVLLRVCGQGLDGRVAVVLGLAVGRLRQADSVTVSEEEDQGAGAGFVALATAGVYSDVDTATLAISDATGFDGYQYRCVVSVTGGADVTSDAATLTVA